MSDNRKRYRETGAAPLNYVAGLGRGATGFTTRSDIGRPRCPHPRPTSRRRRRPRRRRACADFGAAPAGYVAGGGRGFGGREYTAAEGEEKERLDYSESSYDEFGGYSHSITASDPYEQDDEEADMLWLEVDKRMEERRKQRREVRAQAESERLRVEKPKLQLQFSDLKKQLAGVSVDEWDAIPDIGDHRGRKARPQRYTPVPDSIVLDSVRKELDKSNALDAREQRFGGLASTLAGGAQTPAGTVTDLNQIGAARKTVLNIKLHQVSDSVSGQTVVDPKGYLTDLNSMVVSTDAEIGDIKKARLLLKSVTTTNPGHAPGWIAAARLEEVAGRLAQARKVAAKGCQACPKNPDIWLEAARLQSPQNAKAILAKAVRHIPHAVKVWIQAANLEADATAKKRVLRKALEFVPTSVKLWKAAVELEEPDDARILLSRAVECVPHSVSMWLALAKLETYENARRVLNKARETIPTDARIWITAAKLEEANGNEEGVKLIINRSVKSLSANGVIIDREQWLKEAEEAERSGFVSTCQAIVRETIGIGVEEEDRKSTWMDDAESCLAHGCVQTARAIYGHALSLFPGKKSVWLRSAYLEKNHGTKDSLDATLKKAVAYCPQAEILWLMAAKEKWLAGDVDASRTILTEAFRANPDSEQIWLAAVKLESENHEQDRARQLLAKARERAGTDRVWMKSAALERELGNDAEARAILDEAIKKFPQFPKLWMMRGQVDEKSNPEAARAIYQRGLINCPQCVPLWLCTAALEERQSAMKARSLLEKARLKNPKNQELWLAAIEVELRAGNAKIAQTLLAKAIQDCPTGGLLWAQAVWMEPRPKQKSKSVDALKRCDNDPHVIVAVATVFWQDRKVDKARSWLNRAVVLNPDLGDTWAYFYKFEKQQGTEQSLAELVARCVRTDPRHGRYWTRVRKAPENARLKTDEVLKLVAASLPHP
ncbi:PRP1 splicing factor, Nterminal/tetratricopeptide repeat domain containing protein [Acanthamoeba castellanii str. Neff]|uniref:PRP1 splicing factor, Nterminal/tetratricopeptide repeat domain containing protein n=1 Tax=Acanthamoeba castellanii (strain ATCC 30010 / Neff) TaxID=1257118 RepID=L8GYC6_ACACF|nr:PRP1 splicing factor, Nterminal/tetratricopeptide repeat domain containing protein [Acanthamoeba castellanii str. Neff]ELR17957.1 PRP1 splicing factor, Nterminal/tetratricopeptide repeat domain containing protein [Acanthamoeba castellanii str. Neff]